MTKTMNAARLPIRMMAEKKDPRRDRGGDDGRTGLDTRTRPKTKKPSLYRVLLLNDDYTPMEFVVQVLEKYFSRGQDEATRIMLHRQRRLRSLRRRALGKFALELIAPEKFRKLLACAAPKSLASVSSSLPMIGAKSAVRSRAAQLKGPER